MANGFQAASNAVAGAHAPAAHRAGCVLVHAGVLRVALAEPLLGSREPGFKRDAPP